MRGRCRRSGGRFVTPNRGVSSGFVPGVWAASKLWEEMSSHIGKKARRRRVDVLKDQYGTRCFWCHRQMIDAPIECAKDCSLHLTLEHVVPVCKGGTHELFNLVLACFQCNNCRGDSVEVFAPPWSVSVS